MKLKDQDILQRPHSSFLHQQRTSVLTYGGTTSNVLD